MTGQRGGHLGDVAGALGQDALLGDDVEALPEAAGIGDGLVVAVLALCRPIGPTAQDVHLEAADVGEQRQQVQGGAFLGSHP
jgi:hypothetical protein